MLAVLVAISLLGDAVGLVIHYGLGHSIVHGVPIARDLTTQQHPTSADQSRALDRELASRP